MASRLLPGIIMSPAKFNVSFTDAELHNNSWWFCSDWGEIFKSDSFPVIESKNINGIPFKHRLDWINFFGDDTITVMGKTGYFLISVDGGQTWRKDSTGFNPLIDFVKSEDVLIAAGYGGKIWRSSNKGSNWSVTPVNDHFKIYDCESLINNNLIAVGRDSLSNSGSLYLSSDKGISWTNIPGSFPAPVVSISSVDQKSWLADKNGKIFYNSGSSNWSLISTPDTAISVKKIIFSDSLHGWLLSDYNHLYRTTDKGYSWSFITAISTPAVIENIIFSDSLNGIITGRDHYGITTSDGGTNWVDQTIPLPFVVVGLIPGSTEPEKAIILAAHTDCIINIRPVFEITGFEIAHGADDDGSGTTALLELARVFKQYPAKYTLAFTFIPTEELGFGGCAKARDIVFENVDSVVFGLDLDMIGYDSLNSNFLKFCYNNSVSARVYSNLKGYLNNAGISLNLLYEAGSTTIDICLPDNYPTFYIMESSGSSFMNPNYHDITDTWNSLNYPYFTSVTKAVALTAYHISTGELLSAEEKNKSINNYELSDAYPNPFNPRTSIKYSLAAAEFVSIKVYDILGMK
jgi:photosystem II stability/assembly factor-like uncharacterized protein